MPWSKEHMSIQEDLVVKISEMYNSWGNEGHNPYFPHLSSKILYQFCQDSIDWSQKH